MKPDESAPASGVDLFGQTVEPIRDRRGRKSFKKDKQNQDFVAARVADGWSQKRIAEDMGIDEKTLRKYFSRELEFGATFVRGMLLDVLMRKAREGHTASIRLLAEWQRDAGPIAPRKPKADEDQDDDEADNPAKPLGKKEQARVDAQDVPDEYGDIFQRMRARH